MKTSVRLRTALRAIERSTIITGSAINVHQGLENEGP